MGAFSGHRVKLCVVLRVQFGGKAHPRSGLQRTAAQPAAKAAAGDTAASTTGGAKGCQPVGGGPALQLAGSAGRRSARGRFCPRRLLRQALAGQGYRDRHRSGRDQVRPAERHTASLHQVQRLRDEDGALDDRQAGDDWGLQVVEKKKIIKEFSG